MARRTDFTGQRFGEWLVLGRAEYRYNRAHWLCRCDCGEERVVKGDHLRSGASTSCGAKPRQAPEILADRILVYEPGGQCAAISREDHEEAEFRWCIISSGYFYSGVVGLLHVSIAKRAGIWVPGCHIDHVNVDPFDCRRENLRAVTPAQNSYNRKLSAKNTSGYKGVTRVRSGRYAAFIRSGKTIYLGTRDTPEEAHELYKAASAELHGEFGRVK